MSAPIARVVVYTPGESPRVFADVVGYVVVTGDGCVRDATIMPAALFASVLRDAAKTVETDPPDARMP